MNSVNLPDGRIVRADNIATPREKAIDLVAVLQTIPEIDRAKRDLPSEFWPEPVA